MTYDALGRKISETQPNANLASCPAGPPASAMPYTSSTRYDAANRVTGTISADPDAAGSGHPQLAVRNSYDAAGRLITVETLTLSAWQSEAVAPAAWSGFIVLRTAETLYDAMGRKTRDTLREGAAGPVRSVTQYSYDPLGRPDCTAVRMNQADFASPPASACAQGTGGADRISRTIYDLAGQRLQVRVGVGTGTGTGTGVEGAQATWAYNLNGQITAMIDGNGNRAELHYDGHGRQDRWTFPSTTRPASFNDATPATALATAGSVNTADYEQYAYDPNGNRTSLRKRDNTTLTYSYDNLNRMTVKTVPERPAPHPYPLTPAQTRDVYYGYDLRDLQVFARFDSASGEGITTAYDGFGRVRTSSTNMGGVTRTLSYVNDADGNRLRIDHPDGVFFSYLFDGLDRPVFLFENGMVWHIIAPYTPEGGPAMHLLSNGGIRAFGYDALQRPSAHAYAFAASPGVAWTFAYNPAGQIASIGRDNDAFAWTGSYTVNRPYTTNGLNQYSAAGTATFGYDANGNLTSDGTNTFTYDVENRLVGRSGNVTFGYDPLGRLYEVTGSGNTTRFLYDGDALVAEYDASGAMTRRYAHWFGADVPVVSYAGASLAQPSQLHADHQGSIVALSNASGIATINSYDEYGIPGAGNSGRFQYTGQVWLAELGMYHYKGRIYSPTLGRFLQTDPVGYQDQVNLYAYVANDPINAMDPSGLAIIHWRTNYDADITINWTSDERGGARMEASPSAVSDIISRGMTGTVNYRGDRVSVTTQANYYAPGQTAGVPDLKTLEVYPNGQIPGGSADGTSPGWQPYTPGLGANVSRVNAVESPIQDAHELGPHTSGAADQYLNGRDIDGSRITTAYPEPSLAGGGTGNMLTIRPNDRMMDQIFRATTNIVTCSPEATLRCQ